MTLNSLFKVKVAHQSVCPIFVSWTEMTVIVISDIQSDKQFSIPVLVSSIRIKASKPDRRMPVRRTVRRNNLILQSMILPTVMNINPRSYL